jgi:8-oxo-dGTP pyrophosphatase MutT (NUDIX family)
MKPLSMDDVPDAILAAGGIIKGQGKNDGKIAVVRRRRYQGEVSLPKGKLKDKEDAFAAALREVKEETGYQVEIVEYAGRTHYQVKGRPKLVFYFIMRVADNSDIGPVDAEEIEALDWVTPTKAKTILTHPEDRDLIVSLFALKRS